MGLRAAKGRVTLKKASEDRIVGRINADASTACICASTDFTTIQDPFNGSDSGQLLYEEKFVERVLVKALIAEGGRIRERTSNNGFVGGSLGDAIPTG